MNCRTLLLVFITLFILIVPTTTAVVANDFGFTTSASSEIDSPWTEPDEESSGEPAAEPSVASGEIVKVSEWVEDDENRNKFEDIFEPELTRLEESEIVEAILCTEFYIDENFENYLRSAGAEVVYVTHGVESVGVRLTKGLLMTLSKDPRIKMIYGNHQAQWELSTAVPVVRADKTTLNNNGYTDIDGTGVTVVIIDTGINGDHRTFPDGKIIAFKDFVNGLDDLDPTDGMSTYDSINMPHGTMTASCAAGTGGGTSYVGSAPGAYLIVIRVGGSSFDIAQSVQWCISNKNKDFNKDGEPDGPDVISMSLGTSPSSYIDNTCTQAVINGITFVTSAGNSGPGSGTVTSPARAKDIIAIGGIHDNKNIWSSSSRGPGAGGITKPDVVAPAAPVTCAYPGNNWITTYGTSFSGPIAAGVVALMLQLKPTLTPAEVMQILHDTSEDRGSTGPDNAYGWGVVDTIAALDSIPVIRKLLISETEVDEDEVITFGAEISGNILKFEWDFDSDGTFEYTSYTTPDTTHSYSKAGFYEAQLRITDGNNEYQIKKQLIIVENVKPELAVDYTAQYAIEDELIVFNVSETVDTPTDYANLIYSWNFDDGTTLETLEKEITHSFTDPGDYDIEIIVTDDDKEFDTDIIQITVSNVPPSADAGPDIIGREDERLFFSGAKSSDTASDLPTLKFEWDMGDGTTMTEPEFYYVYTESKDYNVALTVTDDNGGLDRTYITASISNVVPSVALEESDLEVTEDEKIVLHGIVNDTSSDMEMLDYYWDFDDGTELTWGSKNIEATHAYKKKGMYELEFKARDDDGAVNVTSITVKVNNVAPKADFIISSNYIEEDEVVYFDASRTTDTRSDLASLEYLWDFDDGTTDTGKTIEHTFTRSGLYMVVLTVLDNDKMDSSISYYVTVDNVAPVSILSVNVKEAYVGEELNFSASASRDTPSDQYDLYYEWNFDDGSMETSRDVVHSYSKPGEYKVTLKVTDDDGGFHLSTTTVTIKEKPGEESQAGMLGMSTTNMWILIVAITIIVILVFLLLFLFINNNRKRRAKRMARRKGIGPQAVVQHPQSSSQLPGYGHQVPPQRQMMDYNVMPDGQILPSPAVTVHPRGGAPPGGAGISGAVEPQLPGPQFSPAPQVQPHLQLPGHAVYPGPGSGPPAGPPADMGMEGPAFGYDPSSFPALPPGLPPQHDTPATAEDSIFGGYTRPVEGPPAPIAGDIDKSASKGNFCGECGNPIRSNWFICPNCENVI
ncbi:MAG: PKD domain-containing protein [Thermoplasmata archaeon]|nr:MAG: PKD domain-containing protein [Thermoplasmata archaeon]